MRLWERLDDDGEVIDKIVLNKETIEKDFEWIQKRLGGTWRLAQINHGAND